MVKRAKPKAEPLIVDAVVRDGKIAMVNEADYRRRSAKAAGKWGDGAALIIRIETEEDAKAYGQLKYFFGYIVEPMEEFTGDTDWALRFKTMFMPDEKTSLTQLSYDEMAMVNQKSEAYARMMCPEAFEQYGREYQG